jgi:hypothetical protein
MTPSDAASAKTLRGISLAFTLDSAGFVGLTASDPHSSAWHNQRMLLTDDLINVKQ